ncbi:unnamed protein product [Malus baccata var. baccata]
MISSVRMIEPRKRDLTQMMKGDKPAQPKTKQYTALNTTITNIIHSTKDKPFLKRLEPLPDHLAKKKPNEYYFFR